MDPRKLLTADYLDIIYDHRNKIYGGYELRKHYDRRLRKATLYALAGVTALLSFSFITANHEETGTGRIISRPTTPADIKPFVQLPKPKALLPPPPAPAQRMRTSPFSDPIIEPDDLVTLDKQLTENKNLTNTQPGITSHDGDSTGIGLTPDNITRMSTGVAEHDDQSILVRWVTQMPQFIGDIGDYLGKNLHYPEAASSAGIQGRVTVEFVINEDGSVSNAKVVRGIGGGCDDEALRIVKNMPRWKPGKQNGTAVKVLFTLPILFQLN